MKHFFKQLADFLECNVAPIANQLDEDEPLFRDMYSRLVALGALQFLIPCGLGGLGGERREWIDYNILMAQHSGALLFLQAQHQFSIAQLKKLLPHPGVEKLFQSLTQQKKGIGLALQKNKNLLRVDVVPEGYRLSGSFRWATGLGYFSHLLASFENEGVLFYTLLPFEPHKKNEGSISISEKIATAVFNAVPSHCATLDRWLVSHDDVLVSHPVLPKTMMEHPSVYNFAGASKALLKIIREGAYGTTPQVVKNYEALESRWQAYYQRILENIHDPLLLRVEGLELAEACSLLARMSCGAASILKAHPLNRLVREIWQYTVAGYSQEQRNIYLSKINF